MYRNGSRQPAEKNEIGILKTIKKMVPGFFFLIFMVFKKMLLLLLLRKVLEYFDCSFLIFF